MTSKRHLARRIALLTAALVAWLAAPPALAGAAGVLDPEFGGDGRVTTIFDENFCDAGDETADQAHAAAVQEDGKIVAAGRAGCWFSAGYTEDGFGLARYNPNGALDPSWTDGEAHGRVRTHFGTDDLARDVALQSDGKVVAAGETTVDRVRHFALARYLTDGSLDPSFGNGGRVVTDFGGEDAAIWAMDILNNGRIVVAGSANTPVGGRKFALARYLSDGSLDASFGDGGRVTTQLGGHSQAHGMTIQANGRIVAAGETWLGGLRQFALARYMSNGSLDASFGDGGKVTTAFIGDPTLEHDSAAMDVAIDGEDGVVAAGRASHWDEEDHVPELVSRFALARYLPDGSLDPWFGIDGRVTTEFDDESSDHARALAIQGDGKLVAAGVTNNPAFFGSADNFGLVRYLPDGTVDFGFGSGGRVTTSFGGRDHAEALAIQPDGKLVAAGHRLASDGSRFALARYLGAADAAPPGMGLTLPPRRERPWEMTATLRDPDTREPVRSAPISFLVDGRVVAEAETDRSGTATAPMPRNLSARSLVRVEFDGDGERGALSVEARYDPRSGISATSE
jgi:uncharacterized delta-60 repeat protein